MQFGYVRVSTREQDTAIQREALRNAGIACFFEDQISGVKARPELEFLLSQLQNGDQLVVYKVDRLARSLIDLLRIVTAVQAKGAELRSLTEPIDTTTSAGRMIFQLFGVFAEFERALIKERCGAGMVAAKARGVRWGRVQTFDRAEALRMRNEGLPSQEIALRLGVKVNGLNRALRDERKKASLLQTV